MLFYFFKISCSARPASRRWTATRSRTLTSRKTLNAFFRIFYCFAIYFFCCFANFYLFCLRRPASRRWTATRSWTLTSRKMLNAFFRIFYCFAIYFFCCTDFSLLADWQPGQDFLNIAVPESPFMSPRSFPVDKWNAQLFQMGFI